ncbi:MAG: transmembrane ion channel [Chitinophagaceae bacterium BSSC1]|nr:MAG: transmembrane ion channel [Chitinophagaceae bacterium BSSC1]
MKKVFLLWLLLLITQIGVFGQIQNTIITNSDSVVQKKLNNTSQHLLDLALERFKDSLRKNELEREISLLKQNELGKKTALNNQLLKIKYDDSLKHNLQMKTIDSLRKTVKGFPVAPFKDTLFWIFHRLGELSASERAIAITKRIQSIAEGINYSKDSFKIEQSVTVTDLFYGKKLVMSVVAEDALWNNMQIIQLANHNQNIIQKAVSDYVSLYSLQNKLKRIGLIMLVLFLMGGLIFLIKKLFHYSRKWIIQHLEKGINGIKIKSYTLLNSNQEALLLLRLNKLLHWAFILFAIYLTLPLAFSILPWTKDIAEKLLSFITDPMGKILISIWDYLPNLFTIIVLVTIIVYIRKGFHFLSKEIENGVLKIDGFYKDWAKPTYQIISILLFAFLIIVIFPYLPGSESPVFKGVSVFIGLLFTFGSTGSLSNIISGLVLTYTRAFKIGDRVKIGETNGDVIEKSLLVTRIRTIKNEIISIPNSNVMNSHTTNYSAEVRDGNGLILHTTVTIGYDAAWETVHQLLIKAALSTEGISQTPIPFVLQTSLDDFFVSYQINAFTFLPNQQAVTYSNLHIQIQESFNEAGVEIMSPHYNAIRDGNAKTTPLKRN